ncbi:MAG TPA: hypothetical protein VKQ29_04500 [Aliidongia sp.]|nr:hypothetical protein [Aliidongia sp.]
MFTFKVIEVHADATTTPHGNMTFHIAPVVGDMITKNDAQKTGQAYEVMARAVAAFDMPDAGDLWVCHRGTESEHRGRIKKAVAGR